jgi:hypothetical protein
MVFALALIPALLLPSDARSLKANLIAYGVMGALFVVGMLHLIVLGRRCVERDLDEHALSAEGLPVRPRTRSWRTVAMLCYVCGPVVLTALAALIEAPLTLFGDSAIKLAFEIVLAVAMVSGWVIGSAYLTIRQWRRQRRVNKRYWPDYRAALRERYGPSPATSCEELLTSAEGQATTTA